MTPPPFERQVDATGQAALPYRAVVLRARIARQRHAEMRATIDAIKSIGLDAVRAQADRDELLAAVSNPPGPWTRRVGPWRDFAARIRQAAHNVASRRKPR